MPEKKPYEVIKHQVVTEKSKMLQELKNAVSNKSLARCKSPKYVFVVERTANKQEIAKAFEQIYKEKNVRVVAVNTINVKSKARRVRGRLGKKAAFKKAVITLEEGDTLENV